MHKQAVFRLGASALLVGLALAVILVIRSPALASGKSAPPPGSTGQQKYCEMYEHALATNLKVSVAQLAAANKAALETTVKQAMADGAITQAQETRIVDKIRQLGSDPCADLARAAAAHRARYANAHQAVLTAVAGALHLPAATLELDLSHGQTVAQIAAAQHVNLTDVNAAYLTAVQDQLKMAVTNGTMTQPQADKMYQAIQRAVANGRYPLLYTHAHT
jgi:hypothetical protein